MKILFLAPANSIHSYRWIKYFSDKGYELFWISFHNLEFSQFENAAYYQLEKPSNLFNLWQISRKVNKLIKEIRPDIVHVHSVAVYGLIGALTSFHPIIATAWGSDVLQAQRSFMRKVLVRYILKKMDLITTDAYHMIKAIQKLGIDKIKVKFICFGIDSNKFQPMQKNLKLLEQLMVLNCLTIISLRNLLPIYDIETLIKAAPDVLKEIPSAKFIIVGTGFQERMLKNLSEELGVSKSIRFVGRIQNTELRDYLTSMDVYVSTSLSDAGIAASTAEAMACGLPVVVTDSGENKEWILDGETGFIVSIKDYKSLSKKINVLLKNEGLRNKFGTKCREIIQNNNDYYKEMEKIENYYRELSKVLVCKDG